MQHYIFRVLLTCLALLIVRVGSADEQNIAGRWFVADGDSGEYLFEDGIDLVDLFSYHTRDSNDDGIRECADRARRAASW